MIDLKLAFKGNGSAPMSVRRAAALESMGFTIAEGVAAIVSMGAVAFADKVPKSISNPVSKTIAKTCIEPHLDTIEKYLDKCRIDECKVDRKKSREERAERYANTIVVYSSAILLSLWAKSLARDGMNNLLGVGGGKDKHVPADAPLYKKIAAHIPFVNWSKEKRLIFTVDEGFHLAALGAMNLTTRGADITDSNIKSVSSILQKTLGWDEERANRVSTILNVWEVPNLAGVAAGYTTIIGKHAFDWPITHRKTKFTDILNGTAKTSHSIVD